MSGRRRIDRILEEDYLGDLARRSTDEIRRMRDECQEEETAVSFARRVLQGKLDIMRVEASRRRDAKDDPAAASILELLPDILRDQQRTPPAHARMSRYLLPPGGQEQRREVDRLVSDEVLATLTDRSSEELTEIVERLAAKERELSDLRRELHRRIDAFQDELIRRYKGGQADPSDALTGRS